MNASTAAQAAIPIRFEAAGSWCFGWLHRASAPLRRGEGVVMCRPMGYEAMCTYQAYLRLAEMLVAHGFDVLRFDYQGTGDSAGGDADPDRVAAWLDSVKSACAELRRTTGVATLSLFGVRLGATLAARAAGEVEGVTSLVMWAPCVTGRAFLRELRAASASRADAGSHVPEGAMEALGYLYTAQTQRDVEALDCLRVDRAPARRALLIARDDLPIEGPLPAAWRDMGMDVRYEILPGYARMMVEPHRAVLNLESLNAIADWLAEGPPPQQADAAGEPVQAVEPVELPGGVCEQPLAFGPRGALFGILTEPVRPAGEASTVGLLMLNVGGNYRIGPNRLYVKMARALATHGYRVLRFDLSGLGDSRGEESASTRHFFSRDSAADVSAAIDRMAAQGCTRFWVMGVCSGSYVAFQSALADPRVTGQVLMNSRLLEWREGADADVDAWQDSMQSHFKSTAFYKRKLMQPQVYARLLRGEVNVQGIAKRMATILEAHLKRTLGRVLRWGAPHESVLAHTRRLSARGTDTLVMMSAEDDGRDYVEFHYGRNGSRMARDPNFRMIVVEGADHTFSGAEAQRYVIGKIQQHLDGRLAQSAPQVAAGSMLRA